MFGVIAAAQSAPKAIVVYDIDFHRGRALKEPSANMQQNVEPILPCERVTRCYGYLQMLRSRIRRTMIPLIPLLRALWGPVSFHAKRPA